MRLQRRHSFVLLFAAALIAALTFSSSPPHARLEAATRTEKTRKTSDLSDIGAFPQGGGDSYLCA